ncbi:hypothetical protein Aduo_005047 [Ancylostoma duodenale]
MFDFSHLDFCGGGITAKRGFNTNVTLRNLETIQLDPHLLQGINISRLLDLCPAIVNVNHGRVQSPNEEGDSSSDTLSHSRGGDFQRYPETASSSSGASTVGVVSNPVAAKSDEIFNDDDEVASAENSGSEKRDQVVPPTTLMQKLLYLGNFELHFGVSENVLGFMYGFCNVISGDSHTEENCLLS